jgi:hypothetical protein
MPKFDERVARQYRYELPPEFPLASPNSGIVHHLSGLNKYAQARTSWSAAVALVFTAFAFTARTGLTPLHSHIGLTPWSVFQDGSCGRATFDNIQQAGVPHSKSTRKSCGRQVLSNYEL